MKNAQLVQVLVLSLIIIGSLSVIGKTVLTQSAASQLAQAVAPTSNLVAHFTFDEGSGTTAAPGGTLWGGATWTTGKVGGAVQLDGVDDHVRIAQDLIGTGPVTIAAWLYRDNLNTARVISNAGFTDLWVAADVFEFLSDGNKIIFSADGAVPAQTWVYITATRDASGIVNMYKNGVQSGTPNVNGGTPTTPTVSRTTIGAYDLAAQHPFPGKIDELRIYNRALSAQEVADLYAASGGGTVTVPPPNNPTPVNGLCSATINTCTSGTFDDVTDTSTANLWQCVGSSGGSTASCSIPKDTTPDDPPPPPPPVPVTAQVIDESALIQLPKTALWNSVLTYQPGNGDTVDLNPPRFSWSYNKNPGDTYCSNWCLNWAPKEFVFQLARSESDLRNQTNLLINVRTPHNMYNAVPALSAGTYYWWVGYIRPKEPTNRAAWTLKPDSFETVPYVWSGVRNFTVNSGAPVWDRSNFANETYLAQKAAHPHLVFTSSSRAGLFNYLQNVERNYLNSGTPDQRSIAMTWKRMKDTAQAYTNSRSMGDLNTAIDAANYVRDAAYVWQLTTDAPAGSAEATLHSSLEAKNPQILLVNLAKAYVANQWWAKDHTDLWDLLRGMGFAYDWLYPLMSAQDKADVLRAFDAYFIRRAGAFHMAAVDGNAPIVETPTTFVVPGHSLYVVGSSHQYLDAAPGVVPALAAYNDSALARKYFDLSFNFMVASPLMFPGMGSEGTQNQGLGYSSLPFWQTKAFYNALLFQVAFPDQKFNLNPYWKTNASWWSAMVPLGATQYTDPYGDGDAGKLKILGIASHGRDLSYFTGDGKLFQQYQRTRNDIWGTTTFWETPDSMAWSYYAENNLNRFTVPAQTTNTKLSHIFPVDGWATGCSGYVNTTSCFNGAGFIFRAAPGNGLGLRGHNNPASLAYQLWAYGAPLTHSGDIQLWNYPKVAESTYSLMVDGKGEWQTAYAPDEPFYSRFTAYKEGPNYTYVAADATNAFPHKTNLAASELGGTDYYLGQMRYVKKVQRHFLFVKNKYFVTFDELAADQPATFSMLYHVPWLYHKGAAKEDKFVASTTPTFFSYTSGNIPAIYQDQFATEINVPVKVAIMNDPDTVNVLDQSGSNVRKNPFTQKDWMSQGDPYPRPHAIWTSNKTKSLAFHFMTVIYPQKPGSPAPKIDRIDDYTAKVTNDDGSVDVISFNAVTAGTNGATIVVDLSKLTPLPVYDDITNSTVTSVPYVPPPTPTAINGSCSTTINMCTAGTFADQADTATAALWQCTGINGGTTASCTVAQTTVYKPGDFNKDGVVNTIDYSLMAGAWNTSNATYDLTKDGSVNTLDYAIMVKNWTN